MEGSTGAGSTGTASTGEADDCRAGDLLVAPLPVMVDGALAVPIDVLELRGGVAFCGDKPKGGAADL